MLKISYSSCFWFLLLTVTKVNNQQKTFLFLFLIRFMFLITIYTFYSRFLLFFLYFVYIYYSFSFLIVFYLIFLFFIFVPYDLKIPLFYLNFCILFFLCQLVHIWSSCFLTRLLNIFSNDFYAVPAFGMIYKIPNNSNPKTHLRC